MLENSYRLFAKVVLDLEGTIGMLLARCPVGVVERRRMGRVTQWTVSLVVQPSLTIMTRQRQFWGSRYPRMMVFLLRVTLQPVLRKNTSHPALHRMVTERRLLTRPGS
jgi:hypothetical protein